MAFFQKNEIWPYLVEFGLFLKVIWLCACAKAYQPCPGRQITNGKSAKSRGFLRKNRFIHVLEMSKSTQNKQLYLDFNTKKVLVRRFMFQSIFF